MIAFITCAGQQERWDSHLSVPKHLVPVDGEPLLWRTVRQLNERGVLPWVVGKDHDARYVVPGSRYFEAELDPALHGQGRFRTSQSIFSNNTRTVEFLGDVFFTDEAMDTIVYDATPGWRAYGRIGASTYTGCQYGEVFAQSFYPPDISRLIEVSDSIINDINLGLLTPGASHWDVYCRMAGCASWDLVPEFFTVIDDFTEDFDYPHDYDNWKERYNAR